MRCFALFLTLFPGITSGVFAADIPVTNPPVTDYTLVEDLRLNRADWSGFNAVLFAGGGFLQGDDSLGGDSFFRSGLVGGSIGYDFQFNQFVLGAGVEGAYVNFRGNSSSGNTRQNSNWLGAATVRSGYDAGRFMPYLSAGIGFGNYKIKRKSDGLSDENTHIGFVAGAGVEAKVTDNVYARLDYKHYEFNSKSYTLPGFSSFTVDGTADIFNIGVGYRF
ncbi:MAG: porin family protein [Roseibium sp.]|uniref:outer membrane protein n=1 Tax=Roseibium sp. TaxID=1936156 RepID=UPI002603D6E2|nr:outer membrane protein [Roseibium sp.]MCV0428928.1 porin family protein [Roseibium sp.]